MKRKKSKAKAGTTQGISWGCDDTLKLAQAKAAQDGRSLSGYVRQLVRQDLAQEAK